MIEPYEGLDALPKSLRLYGASDYAVMAARAGKAEPDRSEHGVVGLDKKGDMWFVDWWTGQVETDKSIEAFIRLVGLHRPIRWFNEGGLIDKSIGPAIRKRMQETQRFVSIEQLPSLSDKAIKLQSFHARVTAGTVHVPIRRPWAEDLIDQLVRFPAGRWDDKADVCGLLGRGIDMMMDARLPGEASRPLLVPFTEKWLEYNDRNQKPAVRYF
jgi:predicted phage terminase large subunit-like protein